MVTFFCYIMNIMSHLNIEIKARCPDPARIRNYLNEHNARFVGVDEQTDTYFHVPRGRLKLREGAIENALIFYKRENTAGPKASHFHLVPLTETTGIRNLLEEAYGVKVVVSKRREIYYLDNVKFHLDEISSLGSFVEIEATSIHSDLNAAHLETQCKFYLSEFRVKEEDLITDSYSDMILEASFI